MSPLRVPNFSPIRAQIRVLWWILRSVRNEDEEEKNEEIKMKFVSLVQKWLERFFKDLTLMSLLLVVKTCAVHLLIANFGHLLQNTA